MLLIILVFLVFTIFSNFLVFKIQKKKISHYIIIFSKYKYQIKALS